MSDFIDQVEVEFVAGSGGTGIVSFLRQRNRPRGGPNGGDGGAGGSIYGLADPNLGTLSQLYRQKRIIATNGKSGGSANKCGANGVDTIINIPVGTVITDAHSGFIHGELLQAGERLLLAKGGSGGFGNTHFRNSCRRAPRFSTPGEDGEVRNYIFELKLMADVGLVGLPNSGKSTLLAALSAAKPKIADYPFSTLEPQLGVVTYGHQDWILADVPGLIENAAQGAGLGMKFLRHLSRTNLLLHLVDISSLQVEQIIKDYRVIERELALYEFADLANKPRWIVFSKCDVIPEEELASFTDNLLHKFAEAKIVEGLDKLMISTVTNQGLVQLNRQVLEYLAQSETDKMFNQ